MNMSEFDMSEKLYVQPSASTVSVFTRRSIRGALIQAHGIMMLILWNLMATNGVLFARYYRYLFAKSRFFESKFWYMMHFPVMLTVICLSLMGMLLIFIERGWDIAAPFRSTFRTVHCTFGFVTIGLSLFQAIAILRPDKDSRWRPYFNWIHRLTGMTIYLCSVVATYFGIKAFFNNNLYEYVVLAWIIWLCVFVIILEVIDAHLRRTNGGDRDEIYEDRHRIRKLKSGLFVAHLVIDTSFTIALICLIIILPPAYIRRLT